MFLNISTFCLRMPAAIGVKAQLAVVIAAVSCNLFSDEMGHYWSFGGIAELYFCHDEPFVLAQKLVNLEGVVATLYEPAYFIDDAWLAKQQ